MKKLKDFFLALELEKGKPLSVPHGGNIREAVERFGAVLGRIIDFSSNVNPFPLPAAVQRALRSAFKRLNVYPDRESYGLKKILAERWGLPIHSIVVGNGSADLLYRAVYALRPKNGLIFQPSFGEYAKALSEVGVKIKVLRLDPVRGFSLPKGKGFERVGKGGVVFFCNPNNPTGCLTPKKVLEGVVRRLREKGAFLIMDEAFIDLAEEESLISQAAYEENLLVLRSLTKFYGLAGLRLGYAVGHPVLIRRIQEIGQPWPVNVLAQAAGEVLVGNETFRRKTCERWLREKEDLYRHLCQIPGIQPFPSSAPFFLVRLTEKGSVESLQRRLWKDRLLIRDLSRFPGLEEGYFRVAVRNRRENRLLVRSLKKALAEEES